MLLLALGCSEPPPGTRVPEPASPSPAFGRGPSSDPPPLPLRLVPTGFVDHAHDDEADAAPAFPANELPSDFTLGESGYGVHRTELRPAATAGAWELVVHDENDAVVGTAVPVPREDVDRLYRLAVARSTSHCDSARMDAMRMRAAGLVARPDRCEEVPPAPPLAQTFAEVAARAREVRSAP